MHANDRGEGVWKEVAVLDTQHHAGLEAQKQNSRNTPSESGIGAPTAAAPAAPPAPAAPAASAASHEAVDGWKGISLLNVKQKTALHPRGADQEQTCHPASYQAKQQQQQQQQQLLHNGGSTRSSKGAEKKKAPTAATRDNSKKNKTKKKKLPVRHVGSNVPLERFVGLVTNTHNLWVWM